MSRPHACRSLAGALHAPDALSLNSAVEHPIAKREAEQSIEAAYVKERTGLVFDYNPFSSCTWNSTECIAISHNRCVGCRVGGWRAS
jgi:hypothetical protein